MDLFDILFPLIADHPKRPLRVAIDGGSASGKTTLANRLALALHCPVVHMDDFFLPRTLRTRERLAEPGGNVHYERFAEEVLPGLLSGEAFSYGVFDCGAMAVTGTRQIPAADIILTEGAYSLHPRLAHAYDLRILLRVDPALQAARILRRNGPEGQAAFLSRWIPLEQQYFDLCSVAERADLVLDVTQA